VRVSNLAKADLELYAPTDMSAANLFKHLQAFSPKGRASFWVSVFIGSMLFHVLGYMALQHYWAQTAKVQVTAAPIEVEFINGKGNGARQSTRGVAVSPGRASKPKSLGSHTNSNGRRRSQRISRAPISANPRLRSRPVAALPKTVEPRLDQPPKPPKRAAQPKPKPKPARPQNPVTAPPPFDNPEDLLTDQPPLTPGNDTPLPPPGGSDNSDNTNRADKPKPPPENNQGAKPGENGNLDGGDGNNEPGAGENGGLQNPNGVSVRISVKESYSGFDRKRIAAELIDGEKMIQIPYPPALNQAPSFELKAELVIDQNGKFLELVCTGNGEARVCATLSANGKPIQNIQPDTAESIARKVFAAWSYKPAQDGQEEDLNLKPVLSTLWVVVQIQKP
jgi:hypothetical protein